MGDSHLHGAQVTGVLGTTLCSTTSASRFPTSGGTRRALVSTDGSVGQDETEL
jgi:hypothetical protein